jgi:hypothetical protein
METCPTTLENLKYIAMLDMHSFLYFPFDARELPTTHILVVMSLVKEKENLHFQLDNNFCISTSLIMGIRRPTSLCDLL